MKVYVVQKHFDYEGSRLISIHRTKRLAIRAAKDAVKKDGCKDIGGEVGLLSTEKTTVFRHETSTSQYDVTIWEAQQ